MTLTDHADEAHGDLADLTPTDIRVETDFLGEVDIPTGAYWGVHTARAVTNFPISGMQLSSYPDLIAALGSVKQGAVRANLDLGAVDAERGQAIDQACQDVREGRLDSQFVVDMVQGGAGTSTNMNANEVIANRALEILGLPFGSYSRLHPIDHVNRSQSTNDVYPTAMRIAISAGMDRLIQTVTSLAEALVAKGEELAGVLKVGRTQLQDAVPMTVGQEFHSWAASLTDEVPRLVVVQNGLREINLGATAIGTGVNADPRYAGLVRAYVSEITGIELATAADLIAATSDTGSFVRTSAALKHTAIKASKICNDLRLLSSGPQAGLGDLRLPARQAGSSIMPGKVNPVIPEVVNQVAFALIGADMTVTMAAEAGQLQLNAFEPIMALSIFQSLQWLTNALAALEQNCVRGIEANVDHLAQVSMRSVGVVTALIPHIGYAAASSIAKSALAGSGTVHDLIVADGLLTREQVVALTQPKLLTRS